MLTSCKQYISRRTQAAPLAVFRVFFGLLMLVSLIRFWYYGWIEKLYITPKFHFSYFGFEWVTPLGNYTYLLFIVCGISALFVTLGYKYRWSIVIFFLSFTYIELMDKTTYLNHYYFISSLAFLLCFLPANSFFSLDAYKHKKIASSTVPNWTIDSIKLLLAIVYFYAGLAKLNSDWLLNATPLAIWLPSKFDIPLLGNYMHEKWLAYLFSWFGALYDLCIPFLLFFRRTRFVAFILVVIFHILTRVLFPIGMFPYIMIVSALIFFDVSVHEKIIHWIKKIGRIRTKIDYNSNTKAVSVPKLKLGIVGLFLLFHLLFPWRYLCYPGELFWTEEGYRFSWRVMLMEKAGYAQFKIVNTKTKKSFVVDNSDFLTPFQEKQMSFQPDFIIEYAHFLGDHFSQQGHEDLAVYVESYVALNGRLSKPFIDPTINLLTVEDTWLPKQIILPFNDTIQGL